jgi:hypothetical protein
MMSLNSGEVTSKAVAAETPNVALPWLTLLREKVEEVEEGVAMLGASEIEPRLHDDGTQAW